MPHLSKKLRLVKLNLTSAPQIFVAPINCNVIEMTADQDWGWCTCNEEAQGGAWRLVKRAAPEVIIDGPFRGGTRLYGGENLFWFWATGTEGSIWAKCTY